MRAFYYFFLYFFNNLLSTHIHKCGEKLGGGGLSPPKPLMSAAYDARNGSTCVNVRHVVSVAVNDPKSSPCIASSRSVCVFMSK